MSSTVAGLVLPQSILTSWWFMWLATIVAFNTIIYLGLTLAKLIPLPRQIHPSRVRGWFAALGADVEKDTGVNEIPTRTLVEADSQHDQMRRDIAKRDIPQAFALVGGFMVLLSAAAVVASGGKQLNSLLSELALGLVFLLIAQILGRRDFSATTTVWTWAVGSVVVVAMFIIESAVADSQAPLAYALIAMTAFAPVLLAWRPALIAGAIMFASVTVASITVQGTEDVRLIVAAFAALVIGATLLRLRMSALNALGDEEARSTALATTDPLTGVLTRNGLVSLMPGLAGIAQRVDEHVCVMLIDIDQLATANTQYGVHYGDDLLRGVAKVIQNSVRDGDLVARWGGDEFLVAGLGLRPAADSLADRIESAVRATGINLGRWATTVTVGTAAGDPRATTFDELVAEAIANAELLSKTRPASD